MKLLQLVAACTLLVCAVTSAQQTAAESLRIKLQSMVNFQAEFAQKVVDAEGNLLQESAGRLVLQQPDKMLWEVIEPDENLLIADGGTLWHVDPFVEQVVAMSQQATIANNPFVLLTDPYSEAWQQFAVRQLNGTFVIESVLPDSQIVKLVLSFDDERLIRLSFEDRQQQVSDLSFNDIEMNEVIPASVFSFSVPEGFTLDDQRQP